MAIPLLNEAEGIESVVRRLLQVLDEADLEARIVLVNNGSTDETGTRIDSLSDPRLRVVHLDTNAGYGGGIAAGLDALEAEGLPDVVGWCWGDGQVDPAVIPALVRACESGAMLAKVRRDQRLDGAHRRLLTGCYGIVLRTLGVQTTDVNGCPKLMRREAWQTLAPRSTDWFLDAEVVLGAEERAWAIHEETAAMEARETGRSKVGLAAACEFTWNLARWKFGGRL